MTDDNAELTPMRSLETDDASVWAEEFVRIFDGKTVMIEDFGGFKDPITVGTMTGWFANCIETVKRLVDQRDEIDSNVAPLGAVSETVREAFVEGVEDGREERRSEPADLDDPTKP